MVAAIFKQNVEVHISDIMKDMWESERWCRKLDGCYREICHMGINLNVEEGSCYEVFQLENQTKISYNMVILLSHTFNLPYVDFMSLKQGVFIEGKVDG